MTVIIRKNKYATAAQLQINNDSRNLLRFCINVPCADSNHRLAINEMNKYLVLSFSQSSLCVLKHENVTNRCDNIVWSSIMSALKKNS